MTLIKEIDYGTPARRSDAAGHAGDRRPGGDRARRHLGHARRDRGRRQGAEALRHRQPRAVRLLPPLPGRDRGPPRHARLLHHAGRARHEGAAPRPPKLAKLRRGVMELYISDHPLDCLTCAANGDCELQDMAGVGRPARGALRLRRRQPPARAREGRVEPLLHLRPVQVHRLLALRARLRGGAGHLRADHRRAAASRRQVSAGRTRLSWTPSASPAAPACRPARPRR